MVKPVPVSKIEGKTSRQAHADLPENTYERELGQDGFYGSATQMYHTHPPTAWESIDGPLKHALSTPANWKVLTPTPLLQQNYCLMTNCLFVSGKLINQ